MYNINQNQNRSVLASLRAVSPPRALRFSEALRIAELQAAKLLELTAVESEPIAGDILTTLPHMSVVAEDLPTSGMSFWNGEAWIIWVNRREPATRQRFTALHEFKHIIDHGATAQLYSGGRQSSDRQAEMAADYFAGCVLMPRMLLKRAWTGGAQTPAAIARRFNVSERAAEVRLVQVGLLDSRDRHPPRLSATTPRASDRYFRSLSASRLIIAPKESPI
jgi:Zn-dependent peptidase ImmA (M78 family)